MKVFVDAMGGDYAPQAVIAGVALAQKDPRITAEIVLLGDQAKISPLLAKFKKKPEIIHCTEVIEMDDSALAVRSKKDSTIVRGLKLTAESPDTTAFFSAGHSGACYAGALFCLGRIPGVERPAIATIMPSLKGSFILVDAGANTECRPSHLVDFARMGSTFAAHHMGIKNPAVGILSNGEEDVKGTELTQEANKILKTEQGMNYLGYIEGKIIFNGSVQVVVTDGFTGNVVLKSLEGLAKTFSAMLKAEIKKGFFSKLGAMFMISAFKGLKRGMDPSEVGAAPLLGVDGLCYIGHGSSNAKAIKNGILRAQEGIERKLHEHLREQFKAIKDAAKTEKAAQA